MKRSAKSFALGAALATVMLTLPIPTASALSPELAKKCRDMMLKAYPPAPTGSRKGSAQAERDYYQTCLAKGGNVESTDTKSADTKAGETKPAK